MERMRWQTAKYGRGLERVAPTSSGLYAIAQVRRYGGLIEDFEYLYIGRSNNLRRRWREHVDLAEPNPGLLGLDGSTGHEFWWTTLPLDRLAETEAELIGHFRPPHNRVGTGRKG